MECGTVEYAVYVYDVKHVVLDNLQFMMSGTGKVGHASCICVSFGYVTQYVTLKFM